MYDNSIIMAGGSGTRLWPASNSHLPKQFLSINDNEKEFTFFSLALERALAVSRKVIVITGIPHIHHVIADACKLSATEKKRVVVIGEPKVKNTAAAIACAVAYAEKGSMIVLTSDHIIEPMDVFKTDVLLGETAAENEKLVVFGIKPSRPETGYGYIETQPSKGKNIFDIAAFHEKPGIEKAKEYASKKNFFWNSGMFAFDNGFIAEQFNLLAQDVYKPFKKLKPPGARDYKMSKGVKILTDWKGLDYAYQKTKSISFDYAIAEKCPEKIVMVKTNFNWIDIGGWDEYAKLKQRYAKNTNGNSIVFCADSNNCFADSDIPVAFAGVDDLIVVIRSAKNGEPAAALITKRGQTQKVKEIIKQIKAVKMKDLL